MLRPQHLAVLIALATLADCAGNSTSADLAPAAAPDPAPVAAAPAPAGRSTTAPPPAPLAQQKKAAALTPEEIKGRCWMRYENDKRIKNIDARLAAVEKCVDETSQPPAR